MPVKKRPTSRTLKPCKPGSVRHPVTKRCRSTAPRRPRARKTPAGKQRPNYQQQYHKPQYQEPKPQQRTFAPIDILTQDFSCSEEAPAKGVLRYVNASSRSDAAGNMFKSIDAIAETNDNSLAFIHPDQFKRMNFAQPEQDGETYPDTPICLDLSNKERQAPSPAEEALAAGRKIYIARRVKLP